MAGWQTVGWGDAIKNLLENNIKNNIKSKNEIWRRMRSRSSNVVGRPLHIDKVELKK